LVATYGNAVHRLLSFTQSRFGGVTPEPGPLAPEDEAMLERARATFVTVGGQIEAVRLRDGLLSVMTLASALNRYLDEAAPWKTLKTDPERAATSLWTALQVVSALRVLTAPYLPFSAQQLTSTSAMRGCARAAVGVPRSAGRAHPTLAAAALPQTRRRGVGRSGGTARRLDRGHGGARIGDTSLGGESGEGCDDCAGCGTVEGEIFSPSLTDGIGF
jgi:methionyl-tRNA synthetase